MKEPRPEISEERIKPVEPFDNPEELMPLPKRLKILGDPLEACVDSPEAKIEALKKKPVQPDTRVEYFSTKVNLYRR